MGERGDLSRQIDRRTAARIARSIALQPADPVYPREPDDGADDHRAEHHWYPPGGDPGGAFRAGRAVCHGFLIAVSVMHRERCKTASNEQQANANRAQSITSP